MEGACDSSLSTTVKGLFVKVVAITRMMSRMVIFFFEGRNNLILYTKHLEKYHVLTPATSSEMKMLEKMSYRLVMSCLLLTMSDNIIRVDQILTYAMVSFILMYTQNFSMYCVETHFFDLCFVLHQNMVGIKCIASTEI